MRGTNERNGGVRRSRARAADQGLGPRSSWRMSDRGEATEPASHLRRAPPTICAAQPSCEIHWMSAFSRLRAPPVARQTGGDMEASPHDPGRRSRATLRNASAPSAWRAQPGKVDLFDQEPRWHPRDTEMRAGRPPYGRPPRKAWRTIATPCGTIPGSLRAAEVRSRRGKIFGSSRRFCGRRDRKLHA